MKRLDQPKTGDRDGRDAPPTNWAFLEYKKAIVADAHHHPPGKHIYRAYGLANFAHDLLVHERKPLKDRGCDVSPLL